MQLHWILENAQKQLTRLQLERNIWGWGWKRLHIRPGKWTTCTKSQSLTKRRRVWAGYCCKPYGRPAKTTCVYSPGNPDLSKLLQMRMLDSQLGITTGMWHRTSWNFIKFRNLIQCWTTIKTTKMYSRALSMAIRRQSVPTYAAHTGYGFKSSTMSRHYMSNAGRLITLFNISITPYLTIKLLGKSPYRGKE